MAALNYCLIIAVGIALSGLRVHADDIDVGVRKGAMLKFLRQMVNQTKADTLNLPANATSIRENITDTFSCANRTYGYYADVDNDCQLFHVCLPSQTPSGRSATYRWSFICPYETVFNQEVLTCTRQRDSIDCEDSPMYYDLNLELGKVNETSQNEQQSQYEQQTFQNEQQNYEQPKPIKMGIVNTRKKPNRKKNNLVVENIREIMNGEMEKLNLQALLKEEDEFMPFIEETIEEDSGSFTEERNEHTILENHIKDINKKELGNKEMKMKENTVLETKDNAENKKKDNAENKKQDTKYSEMSIKKKARNGRKITRGSFRFKADV